MINLKKYVIFTTSLGNIAGGQIYTRNKMKYCQSRGYIVYIFSAIKLEVFIKDFEIYKPLCNEYLDVFPNWLGEKRRQNIISWMLDKIDYRQDDEIVIESQTLQTGCWGELLAKACNGKNFVFLLGEHFSHRNVLSVSEFFDFKIARGEYAGISDKVVNKFISNWRQRDVNEGLSLNAVCNNSVDDVDYDKELKAFLNDNAKKIGIIGRLSKAYIIESTKMVALYACSHSNTQFKVLYIGGGVPDRISEITKLIKGVKNIEYYFTGYIYPIPRKMLSSLDICIAASGSAISTYEEKLATISMDVFKNVPLGMLGYDTTEIISGNNSNEKMLSDYFDMILYQDNKKCIDFNAIDSKMSSYEEAFVSHFNFIENSEKVKQYYEFKRLGLWEFVNKITYFICKCGVADIVREVKSIRKKRGSKDGTR